MRFSGDTDNFFFIYPNAKKTKTGKVQIAILGDSNTVGSPWQKFKSAPKYSDHLREFLAEKMPTYHVEVSEFAKGGVSILGAQQGLDLRTQKFQDSNAYSRFKKMGSGCHLVVVALGTNDGPVIAKMESLGAADTSRRARDSVRALVDDISRITFGANIVMLSPFGQRRKRQLEQMATAIQGACRYNNKVTYVDTSEWPLRYSDRTHLTFEGHLTVARLLLPHLTMIQGCVLAPSQNGDVLTHTNGDARCTDDGLKDTTPNKGARSSITTGDVLHLYNENSPNGLAVVARVGRESVTTGGATPLLKNQPFNESIWPPR